MNLSNIKSRVEKNKQFVEVGMTLYYIDAANCEPFKVTEVTEDEMTVVDNDGNEDVMSFNSLQYGWQFKSKDWDSIQLIQERAAA